MWRDFYRQEDVTIATNSLYEVLSLAMSQFSTRTVAISNRDPAWMTGLIKELQRHQTEACKDRNFTLMNALTNRLNSAVKSAKRMYINAERRESAH